MDEPTAKELMCMGPRPIALRKSDTLSKAVKVFLKYPEMVFPVVDSRGRFIGEIDQHDMLKLALGNKSVQSGRILGPSGIKDVLERYGETVADLMRSHQSSVRADTRLSDIVKVMLEEGVEALKVADEKGRCIGFVTEINILRYLDRKLSKEVAKQKRTK